MRPRITALAVAFSLAACHRPRPMAPVSTGVALDSLRGEIQRVGTEPRTQLTLFAAGSTCTLTAIDAPLDGLEVVVFGRRVKAHTCAFTVDRYVVRAMGGVAAMDGMLRQDGATYVLALTDGQRVSLPALPTALRGRVGARVYWIGPADRAPAAYGVLSPP